MIKNILIGLILFIGLVFADTKIFDINDYIIDLENNRIEYKDESLIFKHEYQDSIKISIQTELIEYENNKFPVAVRIDSIEMTLVDDNLKISKLSKEDLSYVVKYKNNPVKLGGKGTIRRKNYAVLESFPFMFINDSLFFTPSVEYTLIDTLIFKEQKFNILEKIDMVIITTDSLSLVFSEFVEFKKKMGFNTILKTVESIYSEYSANSNFLKIREYIKDMYNNHDLEHVIIGGDHSVIPVGYATNINGNKIPTDVFYSNLDGGLDNNGNGIIGELNDYGDWYADVFVGRFPGKNQEELAAITNKTISYYTDNLNQRAEFYTSFFLSGFNVATYGDGQVLCEMVADEIPENYIIDTFYEEGNPEFNQTNMINSLNAGYNMLYHQSHGDYNKLRQEQNNWALWTDHFYNLTGVSGLYLISSCHPGDISYSGLSQKAMINPNGGCINYLGSSVDDYLNVSYQMHTSFFNLIFKKNTIGESLVFGNLIGFGNLLNSPGGWVLSHSNNIQGDPSNKLFLREPRDISILGINQFKKGEGIVNGLFNMVPNETIEIALIANGEIVAKTSTNNQSFALEYDNLFSDSVYVYYHSQECFLKEYSYSVNDNDSIEIQISDIAINDSNNSGIGEFGDNFNIDFNLNVSVNNSSDDSLKVYIVENSETDLDLLIDSVKISLSDIGVTTSFSIFDIVYNPSTRAKQDSSAQVTMYFEHNDVIVNQEELFIPVADPTIDLQSLAYSEDNIYPTFINTSQGTINKVDISLVEIIKEEYTQVKSTRTLYNIQGLSTIKNDTLFYSIDSTKTYNFEITINDEYTYSTLEFKVNNSNSDDIAVDADHSPGKVNLSWSYDAIGDFRYNVYVDNDQDFITPTLHNFESLNSNKYSFDNDQITPVYIRVAVLDTNNVEFFRSDVKKIDFVPLYQNEFKISQYELYNPMYINNQLVSNVFNSSVSGVNKDGSLVNQTGVIHEAEVNGFSQSLQQGFAIGDINGDGLNDMVNYSYNLGDSVLVKVVDLQTGTLLASKNVYGFIMENAPVLVDYDADPEKEIMMAVFNGQIDGHPKGAYVYVLDFENGELKIAPGFPLYSYYNIYSSYYVHSPSLIDLDGNGVNEIIFDNYDYLVVYDAISLNLITDLKVMTQDSLSKSIQTSLSYCDINEDGKIEMFAITESGGGIGKLFGYNFDGSSLNEIPEIVGGISLVMKPYGFSDLTPPVSFPDLDDDSSVDIVVLTSSKLYIYDNQFNPRANFPIDLDTRIEKNNSSAPSFGDFDGDTILDILFMDANFRVWCYSGSTGNLLSGFPIQIEDIDRIEMTALPIMDLDGDNDLEFAIGTNNGVMLVYDYPISTTRLDTYDKYRGDQFNSGLFGITLGAPTNITTVQNGTNLDISWDPVATATTYKVFVSDEPYTGFVFLDEASSTNYTISNMTDSKKFYYIIAVK